MTQKFKHTCIASFAALCCMGVLNSCSPTASETIPLSIIPAPAVLEQQAGTFKPNAETVLVMPSAEQAYGLLGEMLNLHLQPIVGKQLQTATESSSNNAIRLVLTDSMPTTIETDSPKEGYKLDVTKQGITITATTQAGLFYGIQSLVQMISPEGVPLATIQDAPRFAYRGMHLDVSRNFYDKAFIIKMLDWMSFYKLNTFHWHLTDGAGWRIDIKKYPRLTSEAAFRGEADWKKWWDGDRKFVSSNTPNAYGGFYTQEDIKEVVAYAATKHITVLPEIEMPGHSEEVFVAYPELSCSGKPYKNSDFCIGNEATFTFVEEVLTEVMALFPSEYIHIGGDEAGKTAWKTCPKCKQRMRKEGLANVDELQSYMIKRVEKFLLANNRKLMGWDEITEGGLAPEATVMCWRSEDHAIKAAKQGHDVVMSPGSHMYLDFYQADPKNEPAAIGGYTPVKRVYSYEPMAGALTAEEAKHILGVQANLWTEYVPNEDHVEYMLFPRILALAEVGWSPKADRDWNNFKPRLNNHITMLHANDVNAFPLSYELEVTMKVDTINKNIVVELDAERFPAEIRFTTDGTTPTATSPIYSDAIIVKDSSNIVAAIFEDGKLMGTPSSKRVDYHRGIGKKITYNSKLYSGYMAGGEQALLDGYRGGFTYLDGRWQGYTNSLDAVIDMGEETEIHQVSSRFMQLTGPGVYQPGSVEILISSDGKTFTPCGIVATEVSPAIDVLTFQTYTLNGAWKGRYLQVKASEVNKRKFIFLDEIVIW